MKWRCGWCGKPHERNDPPCDNCGHHSFERAVVPAAPEEDEPIEWVCTECGRAHPRHSPPCSRCGHTTLEKRERNEDVPVDPPDGLDDGGPEGGPGADEMALWVCTACEREHPRHNPPCSRCGNMDLERQIQNFEDVGPSAGGWLAALDLKYALGFAGAFLLLGLILATTFGVLNPGAAGPPTVEDVPGDGEEAAGLSLSEVEQAYVERLNERRAERGQPPLERDGGPRKLAEYNNKRYVKAFYGDGSMPSEDELADAAGDVEGCSNVHYVDYTIAFGDGSLGDFDSESALATALVEEHVTRNGFVEGTGRKVGVDVHVGPDGRVFVTQVVC